MFMRGNEGQELNGINRELFGDFFFLMGDHFI